MVVLGLALMLVLYCNTGYCHNEWVPANSVVPTTVVQNVPAPLYVYPQPLYTVNYQLVPYYYTVPVVTEKRCWFLRRERQITYLPQVYWRFQPVYYR